MKIRVIAPEVHTPTIEVGQRELARCAAVAGISRGKLRSFHASPLFRLEDEIQGFLPRDGDNEPYEAESFDEAVALIRRLLNFKPFPHESVLEHGSLTILFRVSRIATHETVRHRIGAFLQESTRYVSYGKRDTVDLISADPRSWEEGTSEHELIGQVFDTEDLSEAPQWVQMDGSALLGYAQLIKEGSKREQARYRLPHSLPAWIAHTTNLRQWRHVVAHRTQKAAAPEMRFLFQQVKDYLRLISPVLIENLEGER